MLKRSFLIAGLALSSSWFKHKPTEGDKVMMAFLSELGEVHMLKKHDWRIATNAPSGSILIVPGRYSIWFWYRDHGFERMPFNWRGKQIFRKKLLAGA